MMHQKLRPAIAMIELIFALVIMAITMMSAPMLIAQATKSNYTSFQQESIAIVASHTNAMLTYAWDEQNTESQINYENIILKVADGNIALNETNRTTPGKRRYNIPDPLASATQKIGKDGNATVPDIVDDIDDFSSLELNLTSTINATIGDGEYIDQKIQLRTQVAYIQEKNVDFTTTPIVYNLPQPTQVATSNIKFITATLTSISESTELSDKNIVLHAFMCNIGAVPPDSSRNFAAGQLSNIVAGGYY